MGQRTVTVSRLSATQKAPPIGAIHTAFTTSAETLVTTPPVSHSMRRPQGGLSNEELQEAIKELLMRDEGQGQQARSGSFKKSNGVWTRQHVSEHKRGAATASTASTASLEQLKTKAAHRLQNIQIRTLSRKQVQA